MPPAGIDSLVIDLRNAQPRLLPVMKYLLSARTQFLHDAIGDQELAVVAGRDNLFEIRLGRQLAPCRLIVKDDQGLLVNAADLRIMHGADMESLSCSSSLSERVFFWPTGEVSLEIQARGCKALKTSIEIAPSSDTRDIILSVPSVP